MAKSVLVTGGAGFIGSHVVEALCESGASVRVYDDLSTGRLTNVERTAAEFVEGSILDRDLLLRALEGVDSVVHLAAVVSVPESVREPMRCAEVNVIGTVSVLRACLSRGVRRFVQASSSAVYGHGAGGPNAEDSPTAPINPYGASKLSAEHFAAAFSNQGLSCSSLRFFNVYGPRQASDSPYSGVVSAFIAQLGRGEDVTIFGDGNQTRDFIFVGDVARYVVNSLERSPEGHETLNVATGVSMDVKAVAESVAEVLGREANFRFGPARQGDISHSRACVKRLYDTDRHRAMGFREGIELTVRSLSGLEGLGW